MLVDHFHSIANIINSGPGLGGLDICVHISGNIRIYHIKN